MSKMCAGHELLLWHLRRYHGVELCCWLCRLTRDHRLRLRCQHGLLLKLMQLQSRRLLRPRHTRRIDRIFELVGNVRDILRSEEHTSELQSLMPSSYSVFCFKQKKTITNDTRYFSSK